MACRCPELELAIPLRLGLQATGYVALGNCVWWAANQARAFRKWENYCIGMCSDVNKFKCVLYVRTDSVSGKLSGAGGNAVGDINMMIR